MDGENFSIPYTAFGELHLEPIGPIGLSAELAFTLESSDVLAATTTVGAFHTPLRVEIDNLKYESPTPGAPEIIVGTGPKLGIDHRPRKGGHGRRALDILPWAHTAFGNLKTWLRGTFHGASPKHLQRYLDEFSYRFNRRWRETELFGFVLRRVARGQPLPYRRLVAEGAA